MTTSATTAATMTTTTMSAGARGAGPVTSAMDLVRYVVADLVRGVRDFFYGVMSIGMLEANIIADDKPISQMVVKDIKNFTVLALRREKQRQASRKTGPVPEASTSTGSNHRPKIFQRLIQCILLNGGVFLLSLLFFQVRRKFQQRNGY